MMLDNHHNKPTKWENSSDFANFCYYGDMNGYNVVIACMPLDHPGKSSAQSLVFPLRRTFPRLRFVLLVGIGGGVPRNPSPLTAIDDIRLGDVVIGWAEPGIPAVVEYDYARFRDGDDREPLGILNGPDRALIAHLTPFLGNRVLGDRLGFRKNMERLTNDFQHPGLENDILFAANYKHPKVPGQVYGTCEDCDSSKVVDRAPRLKPKPVFHRGTIMSGDSVITNAQDRDALSRHYHDSKVIEMEAAGVMTTLHPLVIKGVSNYADSHKSPRWKKYAAATAAAFARELLYEIRATPISDFPSRHHHGLRVRSKQAYNIAANNQCTGLDLD
ncbi:MAG: hypothetical protein Q9220_005565 [cf. Caloplaca sp. 1 TL-2023]